MIRKFRLRFLMLFVFCLTGAAILHSCKTEPSDLGINFIDPNDTTGTFILDSQADTMAITSNNYKEPVNTYNSPYIMIGAAQNYETKSFLKYNDIFTDYDSATVVSSVLYLNYANYAYTDSNGSISFNIYRVNRDLNLASVTWDSIMASDIGTTILGTYSGTPVDSETISIALDVQLIKDWLEYSADTNYPVKNYGIAIIPNLSSNSIKAFSSSFTTRDPYIQSIVTKNGETDTLTMNSSLSLWLANAPASVLMPDRFTLQNGIAFNDLMGFNLTKLPSNVVINDALLILTLDTVNSFILRTSDRRLRIGAASDSVNKTDTTLNPSISLTPVNGVYEIRLTPYFQYWNNGTYPNLGIILANVNQFTNLDEFVFYSPSYSDLTKVPRLRIRYTPRLP